MYYDPMISKLITWGPTREDSMKILDRAFDEYVIQGLTHNIGFGKSILANRNFWNGDYSTDFIPNFYPDGFTGDNLSHDDHVLLSVAAHHVKNIHNGHGSKDPSAKHEKVFFISIDELRDHPKRDLRVEDLGSGKFKLTDLTTQKEDIVDTENFEFDYNALVTMNLNGKDQILQFSEVANDALSYKFYLKGNHVNLKVFSEEQMNLSHHMPVPAKIDYAKSIMSPMPG